jgi:hypothetical protein
MFQELEVGTYCIRPQRYKQNRRTDVPRFHEDRPEAGVRFIKPAKLMSGKSALYIKSTIFVYYELKILYNFMQYEFISHLTCIKYYTY